MLKVGTLSDWIESPGFTHRAKDEISALGDWLFQKDLKIGLFLTLSVTEDENCQSAGDVKSLL
jgi:hypothetical protein